MGPSAAWFYEGQLRFHRNEQSLKHLEPHDNFSRICWTDLRDSCVVRSNFSVVVIFHSESDRCALKFYKASKHEQFWANFFTLVKIDWPPSRNSAIFQNFEINMICADGWVLFCPKFRKDQSTQL